METLTTGTKVLFVEDGLLLSGVVTEVNAAHETYWIDRDIAREADGSGIAFLGRAELVALA